MGQIYTPAAPDKQEVRLRVMDQQVDLARWESYSFASNVLTPSDGWSLTASMLDDKQRAALKNGARVRLYVDRFPLAEGYIETVEVTASRGSGAIFNIHGRDRLGAVVDAIADPRAQFKTGATLAEFLKQLLAPYGWASDTSYVLDRGTDRDAKTGGLRGTPTSRGQKKFGKPLKNFVLHQLKPHNHEGLFRFIQRTVERFGLLVRVSADGEQIIVAAPDFTQPPRYQLRRKVDATNILSGSVRFDSTDQPSVIVADGFSGGGEFGRGRTKTICVNPYFGVDADGFPLDHVVDIIKRYPEAEQITITTQPAPNRAAEMPPRPVFLHDEESKTQDQLNWFVRRTMSEFLRRSLTCHYVVEGHGQTVDGAFTPWDVDTVVEVQDDLAGLNERMYVLGRTFDKSRHSGTTTTLELIRLGSIAVPES